MLQRPRRLRKNSGMRSMVRETSLNVDDLIYPMFVVSGKEIKEEIKTLPDCYHMSIDILLDDIREIVRLGIKAILLFGIPKEKDEFASSSWNDNGIVQQAVREIKGSYPELLVITDICLCAYTSHGHCGIIKEDGGKGSAIENENHDIKTIDNDKTLEILAKIALSHAKAGADIVAPSDMMDGRVFKIREALDSGGYHDTAIMSYSAKYASAFYGPFRDAADSAPQFGDRSTYQMDYSNSKEALKEVKLDIAEGADIVMIKPALSYLDIIKQTTDIVDIPVAAYSVSGEYAMVKHAAQVGLCKEQEMMTEILTSIKRAGADIIITYYAKELAQQLS